MGDTFKFYLDFAGDIFVAEEIEATPDTYGIVTYYQAAGVEDAKIKMYTSEDKTKTYTAEDEAVDALVTAAGVTKGTSNTVGNKLISYSLDKDGVIDAIDPVVASTAAVGSTITSKLFTASGEGIFYFTKDTVVFVVDNADSTDIWMTDVASLEETTTATAYFLANEDKEVVALFVNSLDAGASADSSYGVFHSSVKTYDEGLEDAVRKLKGFVDGNAFTTNTNDAAVATTVVTGAAYKVEYDADGYIDSVTLIQSTDDGAKTGTWMTTTVAGFGVDETVIVTSDSGTVELDDAVVVYFYDQDDEVYEVSKASSIKKGDYVVFYEVDKNDNTTQDIVIFTR